MEKSVARRVIFDDHVRQFKELTEAARNFSLDDAAEFEAAIEALTSNKSVLTCRLTYPPNLEFLPVPYGMILQKGQPELKSALNRA